MNAVSIRFSGQVLERGFWIYVIEIRSDQRRVFYVGRTGDSSSRHAGSPFARIGQHLDLRASAKGNALLRNLRQAGLDAAACDMEMIAVGPLFPEQATFDLHRPIRDRMAALEVGLARYLRGRGYEVLGMHAAREPADPALLQEVLQLVEPRLLEGPC
jgi:hypothetical protein